MKGVVLAGGKGTRLRPVTKVINKHLLPVYDRPMIFFPIQTLATCGIKDILVVSSPEHINDFVTLLGSGSQFGVSLNYEIQDQPGGISDALIRASTFVGNQKMAVMLGDNIVFDTPIDAVKTFMRQKKGAYVFLKEVEQPKHFGIAKFDKNGNILSIVEKPKRKSPSPYAVIGMYLYNPDVFEVIKKLKPSERGELEITDVNNYYAELGILRYELLDDLWIDAGSSLETLYEAASMVKNYNSRREHSSI